MFRGSPEITGTDRHLRLFIMKAIRYNTFALCSQQDCERQGGEKVKPTILDLFAGAGGMSLGFHTAGGVTLAAVDREETAAATYRRMFAADAPLVYGGPERGDVQNLPAERLVASLPSRPDLVVGGPPCQGFSRIGRAKQASLLNEQQRTLFGGVRDPERNDLYLYFLDVVKLARPLAFVMENVPGLKNLHGVDHARRIAREAASLGYRVRYFLLNAVHYGVPQLRWRLFFVGYHRDLGHDATPTPPARTHIWPVDFPEGFSTQDDSWMLWGENIPQVTNPQPAVTVHQAIGDLPRLREHLLQGGVLPDRPLPRQKRGSSYAQLMCNWPGLEPRELVNGNWYRDNGRDFETFARMAEGDRYPQALRIAQERFLEDLRRRAEAGEILRPGESAYQCLREEYLPPYRNDAFDDKWHKLNIDQPSWTVTAHLSRDTYSHIHYDSRQARTITIREAARLQSFPDSFEFSGNYGEQFQQIGNAVPPLLSWAIAAHVYSEMSALKPSLQWEVTDPYPEEIVQAAAG